jgi:hypothetical protein
MGAAMGHKERQGIHCSGYRERDPYLAQSLGGHMHREIDVVEGLLMKWADFMRRPENIAEGFPAQASGCLIPSWIKDSEELFDNADDVEIDKIKATLASLSQPHYRIINKRHGISYMVWSFPNEDALYHAAKQAFEAKHFTMHRTQAI